jgi:hypothetical protein
VAVTGGDDSERPSGSAGGFSRPPVGQSRANNLPRAFCRLNGDLVHGVPEDRGLVELSRRFKGAGSRGIRVGDSRASAKAECGETDSGARSPRH